MNALPRRLLTTTALTHTGLIMAGLVFGAGLGIDKAQALPQGGQVVGGAATIDQTSATQLDITQSSSRAVIDWRAFSIGGGETTTFHQPNSSSVAVNRVTGVDPSTIAGHLNANGQVVLVNPNGILFSQGASVNVGGLVATTAGISKENAMAGNFIFDQPSNSSHATVVNEGKITAARGGLVALVAPGVANSGTIRANLGKVSLASGNAWTLDLYGDHLVNFAVEDGKVTQDVSGPDNTHAGVSSSGRIFASAGTVEITADVAKNVVSSAISLSGIVEAKGVHEDGGTIVLDGGEGDVTITPTGRLDASGAHGGTIRITGNNITQNGTINAKGHTGKGGRVTVNAASAYSSNESHISISGLTAGGTLSLQAGSIAATNATIDADALGSGNGGSISLISTGTTDFAGAISARGGALGGNGGTVETSGHTIAFDNLNVDTTAARGRTGTWLLDPFDLTINSADGVAIGNALATSNVFLQTTAANTGASGFGTVTSNASGDIDIAGAISWNSANSLTLSAYHNISVGAAITDTGAGNVILRADNTGISTGTVSISGPVSVGGTASLYYNPGSYSAPTVYAAGQFHGSQATTAYMLVNTAGQLANVATNLAGTYALGANIAGVGVIAPIGSATTPFSGVFDGNGGIATYTLGNVDVVGTTDVGLFGVNTGTIRDLAITSGVIAGTSNVGGIVGFNNGSLSNVAFGGVVNGSQNVGGLVGQNGNYSSAQLINGDFLQGGSVMAGAGGTNVGGLVGINYGTITGGLAEGNVSSGDNSQNIGGFVGNAYYGLVSGGTVTGSVVAGASNRNAGGFAGFLQAGLLGSQNFNGALSSGNNSQNIGGIAGMAYGVGITGATSSGTIFTADNDVDVGGVAGLIVSGAIANGTFSGLILAGTGNQMVGGIVGSLNTSSLLNSTAAGAIIAGNGASYVGGLAGLADSVGTIDGGTAGGIILVGDNSNFVGGAVGNNRHGLANVTATGLVSVGNGATSVGGLVGYNSASGIITNGAAAAASTVSGADSAYYVGGLIGSNVGTVSNGTANNFISFGSAASAIGGLAGYNAGLITGGSVNGNVLVGANGAYVGGGVGWNDSGATIDGLGVIANVNVGSGSTAIGGIAGLNGSDPRNTVAAGLFGTTTALVSNSSFTGNVSAGSASFAVGGIVGWNATWTKYHLGTGPLIYGTLTGNTGTGGVTAGTGSFQVRTAEQAGCDQASGCGGTAGTDVLFVTGSGSASKVYGSADPTAYTYTVSGLTGGDTQSQGVTGSLARVAGENAGTYAITEGSLAPDTFNYTISYTAGTLTITPAPLTIAANDAARAVNQPNPPFTATFSGLTNGDSPAVLTGLSYSTNATPASTDGVYTITPYGVTDKNYKITYVNGTMIVGTGGGSATGGITPVTTGAGTPAGTIATVTLAQVNSATASGLTPAQAQTLFFNQFAFGNNAADGNTVTCLTPRERPTDVCQVPLTIQGF